MLLWFNHPGFSYNFRSSHAYSIFCEYSLDSTFSWMQSKQQLLFDKEYDCMVGRFVQPVPSEYKKMKIWSIWHIIGVNRIKVGN